MIKIFRKIVSGEKRGRRIGFPTLNFVLGKKNKIKRGVWVVKLKAGRKEYFGAANAGRAKTFRGGLEKIEVYLFSEPPAKIKKAEIYFLKYLRKTKKFKTVESLKKQIKNDVKKGKSFLASLKEF